MGRPTQAIGSGRRQPALGCRASPWKTAARMNGGSYLAEASPEAAVVIDTEHDRFDAYR